MSRTPLSQAAHEVTSVVEGSTGLSSRRLSAISASNENLRARGPRWKQWALLQHLFLVILVATFASKGLVPAWRQLNSDFPNYYLVARLYRAGYPLERVYDWTWFQRQKDHQGIDQGLVSFIPSTLLSGLAVAPWSSLPPLEAKHRWLVLNLAFLLLAGFLLVRMTKLGWERATLLIFLAFIPLRNNFLFGQMHVVVLLLITVAAWLFFRDSQFLSGISLAAAAALKIYPALFLIYFVWKRQWRAVIGLITGLAIVAAVSLYLFGTDACLVYVRQVLPAGLRGETLDPYNPAWNSWTALLRRLFIAEPELNPLPVAHLPWLYAVLQPLIHTFIFVVFMWAIGSKKRDPQGTKIEWAIFLFLLLFLSSQPGSYHFVALILTAALVVDYLLAQRRVIQAGIAIAIYTLIGAPLIRFSWAAPAGWQNLLFFSRLAWMCSFGALLLWILIPRSGPSLRERFNLKSSMVAACAVIMISAAGFIATRQHLRGQFENYNSRIATTPGGLLASDPAITSSGILFTTMTPTGYTIRRVQDGKPANISGMSGDVLHPTASDDANLIIAELSTRNTSRIVRFSWYASGQDRAVPTEIVEAEIVEAEDAQEPVSSRDGKFLAFLRPVNGRNSLWVQTIGAIADDSRPREPVAPREITGVGYDVHEVAFLPDHRLIFSSKRNGHFALYMAGQSAKSETEELRTPNCSARYPAISPDGRWMAFSCEQAGAAQLHVTDLAGKRELQLTTADCNSISPAWTADSKRLVYATDCGRGLGLTALAQLTVFP
jgi:Glycosyltransferase family 87/WD40-like Beta Propeller Repeat